MKKWLTHGMFLSLFCCVLASCSDAPQANGFGPVPHEKDVEDMIEKVE